MDEFNQGSSAPQGGFQSRMIDVSSLNLSCAECGVAIKELPFQPTVKEDGTYGKLYCRECNSKRPRKTFNRGGFGGGGGGGGRRDFGGRRFDR